MTCGMLERLEGTALLNSGYGKAVPIYKCILQAPGCLLTNFITTLMDQTSTEVGYSRGGEGETNNL